MVAWEERGDNARVKHEYVRVESHKERVALVSNKEHKGKGNIRVKDKGDYNYLEHCEVRGQIEYDEKIDYLH